jgi:transcriptional regulator with XRE-family HTH domain
MTDEEARQNFAAWLNEELRRRGWTQGKLILHSGSTNGERLSSAAVSRYSTGKMLPDIASIQKIARALDLPVDFVLRKGRVLEPLPTDIDWLERAVDDLAHAVEAEQLSEEGRIAIVTHIRREKQVIEELKSKE